MAVFSAFTFAYAAFEILGWLGDVIGPRKVLARIVLWWSAYTMATGLAWSFVSLVVARFLLASVKLTHSEYFAKLCPMAPARERGSATVWSRWARG
jgi:MFS family permease